MVKQDIWPLSEQNDKMKRYWTATDINMEFLFKNWFQNTNLSIHIARFSASESLRVYTNIYKNSPPFASR